MKKLFFVAAIFSTVISCTNPNSKEVNSNTDENQQMPMIKTKIGNLFSIDVFSDYVLKKKEDQIDNSVHKIIIDSDRYIIIQMGYNISTLTETDPEIVKDSSYFSMLMNANNVEKDDYVFVKHTNSDEMDLDLYRLQNIRFDTIDNRFCKIISPRIEGKGISGVHFYKVFEDKTMGSFRVNIFGYDLTKSENDLLMGMIKSIEFL